MRYSFESPWYTGLVGGVGVPQQHPRARFPHEPGGGTRTLIRESVSFKSVLTRRCGTVLKYSWYTGLLDGVGLSYQRPQTRFSRGREGGTRTLFRECVSVIDSLGGVPREQKMLK